MVRRCTQQLCCKYFRSFVAFLFSTVGSCCLMVVYVMLGGLIFCGLERGHRQAKDVDIQSVKKWHLGRLWNLSVGWLWNFSVGWLWNLSVGRL